MANANEARAQRNRQLADLGAERRFEITTADDRDNDPFIRYDERDLEKFRNSVQNAQTFQLQKENQSHLAKWSNFHETVEDAEKDLPDLMGGQSHRARLHFEMRIKGAQITMTNQRMAPPQAPSRPTHMHGHGQGPSKGRGALGLNHGPPISRGKTKSLLDPAADHPQSSGATIGIQIKGRATKIQRRPAPAPTRRPTHDYVGSLLDPSSWLEDARRKMLEKPAQPVKPVQPMRPIQAAQPTQAAQTVNPAQTVQPIRPIQAAQPTQTVRPSQPPAVQPTQPVQPVKTARPNQPIQAAPPTNPTTPTKPAQTVRPDQPAQPVQDTQEVQSAQPTQPPSKHAVNPSTTGSHSATNFEKQVLRSNLPQPLTSNSSSQSQSQSQHDPNEDLLIDFDATPEKIRPAVSKTDTMSDPMDIDETSQVNDTMASTAQDNIFRWLQELGVINDTLADFDFSNVSQKKLMMERKDQLVAMLNATLTKNNDNSGLRKQQEKKTEPSMSPLQISVKAQPFVPLPKAVGLGASVRKPLTLDASKYAPSKINVDEKKDNSKKTADSSIDYWQKTLPRRASLKQPENEPPAVPKQQKVDDPKKMTLYQSRYAC